MNHGPRRRSAFLGRGLVSVWFCAAFTWTVCSAEPPLVVEANRVVEVALATDRSYPAPFAGITVDAVVTAPDGAQAKVPAFWAGGSQWRFRYSSSRLGTHAYRTECSDAANPQLHGVTGKIEVVSYRGDNPLYRHGPVQVAKDRRHFELADGTPFFWLGDTWWKGLSDRISWEGFQRLTADRKGKGFTVVQIVAGPLPDEPPFDPRWANEGGMPYEKDYARVNPAYFDYADRRIQHLIDAGITPAIVGGWGWHMPSVGVEKMNRHWRYLVARYAAYPVVWIIGGEAGGPQWTEVGQYLRKTDPYHRVATFHPYSSARRATTDETVIDFDMLQTGHNDWNAAANTISKLTSSYSKTPPMPVLVGEVVYEGHMMANRQDIQRYMFWSSLLNGAAGHTYGAGGIWQMNSETVRGAEYEFTPWFEAMELPGSAQLGRAKKLLEEYPWWRFEPHPEWVEPHGTTLFEPHAAWYDDNKEWKTRGGKCDLPYAAGIPGEVRFIFIPGNHFYAWQAPAVTHLETNADYHAFFFDPAWAKRYDLGRLIRPQAEGPSLADDFASGDAPAWKDYGTPTQRRDGHLVGGKGMISAIENFEEADVMTSADANSDAEAGLMLRFHDPGEYLVALYSPSLKAIYVHDRKKGAWGSPLGRVAVPAIGPHIRLTAAVCGDVMALVMTDGKQTYATPSVKIGNKTTGKVGLWLFQIGECQQYDKFRVSRLRLLPGKSEPKGLPLVLHENPGILTEAGAPETSILLGDTYAPPRLPAPQDWVLVLERVKSSETQR
jgi:hypothetical protein